MKIPAPYRQDAPTAAEPVAAPVWTNKPAKKTSKASVQMDPDYRKPPCDSCEGKFHPPLQVLKYLATMQMWLCETCRQDY